MKLLKLHKKFLRGTNTLEYLEIKGDHFEINDAIYDEFEKRLSKPDVDIDVDELHLGKDEPYLEKILQAYLSNNLPDLGGEGFNGIVKVLRRSYNAADTDRYTDDDSPNQDKEILLKYMDKDEFYKKADKLKKKYDESDYNNLRQYYTIDYDNGATTSVTTTNNNANKENEESGESEEDKELENEIKDALKDDFSEELEESEQKEEEEEEEKSASKNTGVSSLSTMVIVIPVYNGTSVSTEKIPYQQVTSKYGISIGMLISNLQASRNPEYISALCDLVMNNSKIDLVVQETVTKTETYNVTKNGETLDSTKETIGVMKYVREADTWIVNSKQEYFKNEDKTTVEQSHDETTESWTKTVTTKVQYKATPGSSDETYTENISGGDNMNNSLPEGSTRGTKQDIPNNIRQSMKGKSMIDNDNIGFDDLQYLTIPYINFSGQRSVGNMVVNKSVADDVLDIFEELYNIKYPIERMELVDKYYEGTRTDIDDHGSDYASIEANNTSAFNYRGTQGTGTSGGLSNHAKGLSIDINPKINPYLPVSGGVLQPGSHSNASAYFDRSEENKNSLSSPYKDAFITENSEIVSIFRKHGWRWLITDSYWDTQHFDKLN